MTKKEFIELTKDIPDDFDIVFRTNSERLDCCLPLEKEHICFETYCTNMPHYDDYPRGWFNEEKAPILHYKKAIVLEAIPYDYLENKYFIHIAI